jgi:hypothetical protein
VTTTATMLYLPEAVPRDLADVPLTPEMREDLTVKSGLCAQTIKDNGICAVQPARIPSVLGSVFGYDIGRDKIEALLEFPYHGLDVPHSRYKCFPSFKDKTGHENKYIQRKGSSPRLYIPHGVEVHLQNPEITLYVVEGEKKTLALVQAGRVAVGIGGVWSWCQNKKPIPDLDLVAWQDRKTTLVFDSDIWTRSELMMPVYGLAAELKGRGAIVSIVRLPQ